MLKYKNKKKIKNIRKKSKKNVTVLMNSNTDFSPSIISSYLPQQFVAVLINLYIGGGCS